MAGGDDISAFFVWTSHNPMAILAIWIQTAISASCSLAEALNIYNWGMMTTGMTMLEDGCMHLFISARDELLYRPKLTALCSLLPSSINYGTVSWSEHSYHCLGSTVQSQETSSPFLLKECVYHSVVQAFHRLQGLEEEAAAEWTAQQLWRNCSHCTSMYINGDNIHKSRSNLSVAFDKLRAYFLSSTRQWLTRGSRLP